MDEHKNSFLYQLVNKEIYDECKDGNVQYILLIYFIILSVLYVLSYFIYWKFLSDLLSAISGTSLFYILFLCCVILKLDIPYKLKDENTPQYEKINKRHHFWSIVWGCFLFCCGILSMYVTEKHADKYEFECSKFTVDLSTGTAHLFDDCDALDGKTDLKTMKGHEVLKQGYTICSECASLFEEYEDFRDYRKP